MRSSSLPLLLGLGLALALPSAASALDFSPILQPAEYDPLPIEGTDPYTEPMTTHPLAQHGSSSAADYGYVLVDLPFGIFFYGQYYDRVYISVNGYAEFGTIASGFTGTGTGMYYSTTIPNSAVPNGIVAVWWDDNECRAGVGSIKTQRFGASPNQTFVIEWDGCNYYSNDANTHQVQLWLIEGSPNIRVHYGDIVDPTATQHSATTGIENSTGTAGEYGLPCNDDCEAADFPVNTIIQYGRSPIADLMAYGPGVTAQLTKHGATMTANLEISIQNVGLTAASGVTWKYYLSTDRNLDANDIDLQCVHSPPVDLSSATGANPTVTATDTCTLDVPPPGVYRICALVDPDNLITEALKGNNFICSDEFVEGADLLGTVSIEETGGLGHWTTVHVEISNRGTDPSGQFDYEIRWNDCNNPAGDGELFYKGTLDLASTETHVEDLEIHLDTGLTQGKLCAELFIDPPTQALPHGRVLESSEANNRYSTCDEVHQTCMLLTRPNLKAKRAEVDFPHGCFFGDVVNLQLEVCNDGAIPAQGFGVRFSLDINPVYSWYETEIVSIPQSCFNEDPAGQPYPDGGDSQCLDIGGGQPACIKGLCRAPCAGNSNADCGDTGLECLPDPHWVVDGEMQTSCQFRMDAGECRWFRTTAQIPMRERDWTGEYHDPFEDNVYFFSGVADHGMIIGEENEGDNDFTVRSGTYCWTRKADLEPVELNFVGSVGAGETFPVYHRVRNHGVVGAVYSYQYVLTSNTTVSDQDMILEIVGRGTMADSVVEPFADSVAYDILRIPENLVGGEYYLGIIVDPENRVPELRDDNNTLVWCDPQEDGTCLPRPVPVIESSLQIVNQSLPTGTVGQSYQVQLRATGGNGSYQWALTSGALPPGLSLSESGLIHGVVLEQGYHVFQVTVTSGAAHAAKTFPVQAAPASSPLTITTLTLPPAFLDQPLPYTVELGASGGHAPYVWDCEPLPDWLRLANNILTGTPVAATGARQLTCTVKDQSDRTASITYSLVVRQPSAVRIRPTRLSDGNIGEHYNETIDADGGSGVYDWDVAAHTLPPGLRPVEAGNIGRIEGVATACGTFLVSVTVVDLETGASDAGELPLTIVCDGPSLASNTAARIPVAVRGEWYEFQLESEDAVSFDLAAGVLPIGLTLSKTGLISGEVSSDARTGPYSVAVELTGPQGEIGLGALTLMVEAPPPPPLEELHHVKEPGCSSSGESSASGLLPFAALFALLGLRRFGRRAGIAALGAAALLAPSVASAQDALGYGMQWRDITYQQLENGTGYGNTGQDSGCSSRIQLPFEFPFYGEVYEAVYIELNGTLRFSSCSGANANAGIPTSSTPNNYIAPWWDDLRADGTGNDIRYEFRGTAPNREFVVEWLVRNWYSSGSTPGEMQVSLYEDGTFAMRWGDVNGMLDGTSSSLSGTVGVEDANGTDASIAAIPCSSSGNCKKADWETYLQQREVLFATFANLRIGATATAAEMDPGIEQQWSVTLWNEGPKAVAATDVDLVISRDLAISDDDYFLATIPDVSIGGLRQKTVTVTQALPRDFEPGPYYLLARVDHENLVEEWVEDDNAGGNFRFVVRQPMPDLAIESVFAPTSGTPGSQIAVVLTVANLGNEDAFDVPYWVVLSDNDGISAQDLVIHQGIVDVGWMQTEELTALIQIPVENIPVGTYRLGAVIDPNNDVEESNELNNIAGAAHPFTITATDLRIVTHLPSELEVGAPYCIPLVAEGGDGVVTWSIAAGEPPPGLVLNPGGPEDPLGASICGEPSRVGLYEFRLRAESGGMSDEAEYSLNVTAMATRLVVASGILPYATFNRFYEAGLIANGGRAPYRWELVDGELPLGLVLEGDGLLFGTPAQDGTFGFSVRVSDALGGQAVGTIRLQVVGQGRVECATRSLGTLVAGQEFTAKLLAGGGVGPYGWQHVSTHRYGETSGGTDIDSRDPPPGIKLNIGTGDISGAPSRVGRYIWTVRAIDDRKQESGDCPIALEVVAAQRLTVATTRLPLAIAGVDYSTKLEAQGGVPPYRWSTRDLRGGLTLTPDGFVTGKLEDADLQGQKSRTYSFLVEVRDAQDNVGHGALSVTLTTEPGPGSVVIRTKTETGGCATAAGGVSLLALGLVALGLRRRR